MRFVVGLLIIVLIIVIHEFGHFIIAKVNGIRVKEFFVGIGPVLFKKTVNGTEYTIRLIPFGGACVFDGMYDDEEELFGKDENDKEKSDLKKSDKSESDETESDKADKVGVYEQLKKYCTVKEDDEEDDGQISFPDANVWQRIAVVAAGPIFNFILAYVLALFVIGGTGFSGTYLYDVVENSPAEEAGLRAGDEIIKVNGSNVYTYEEVSFDVGYNGGKPMKISYRRDGKVYNTEVVPELDEKEGRVLMGVLFDGQVIKPNALQTLKYSYYYVRLWIKISIKSVLRLFTGKVHPSELSSAVGVTAAISSVYTEAAHYGIESIIYSMLEMTILISANLGVMNFIPFPALDGGKLIFLLIEAVTKKPVSKKVEAAINLAGMICLCILMVYVVFNDFVKLKSGFFNF